MGLRQSEKELRAKTFQLIEPHVLLFTKRKYIAEVIAMICTWLLIHI